MSSILNLSDISLEEDRFEVDCWRYVGEPVVSGSRANAKSSPARGLDSGKSSAGSTSEGWFGLSKHKRTRTISLQRKPRSDSSSANLPPPPPATLGSSSGQQSHLHKQRGVSASSTSGNLSSASSASSFASAGSGLSSAESGHSLGLAPITKKASRGKKDKSSFFGLGVGNRRSRKEEVESWRRAKLICQGDLRGDESIVTVYDGDVPLYQFRPRNLQATDISVPHKSLYTDRPCIRIVNVGKAMIQDPGDLTPMPSKELETKRSFFQGSSPSSSGACPPRANSLGEVKRKTSSTPSLRSFASSHSLSIGSRTPSVPPVDRSHKQPTTSPYPPQISPRGADLTPLTGPWLSPVSSNTSYASSQSTQSGTSVYSTAREEEAQDALSPLMGYSTLPDPRTGKLERTRPEDTTPKATRTYHRKPNTISRQSDETIPTISLHAAQPSSSPTSSTLESLQELAFVFEDASIQQAWYGLLKSLARPEIISDFGGFTGRTELVDPFHSLAKRKRLHRILELTIHDIKEFKLNPRNDLAEPRKKGIMRSISSGIGQTIKGLAEDDREDLESDQVDSFFFEIRLDNEVMAKTSVKALNLGLIWSETFQFSDLPEWHRLSFHLFRSSVEAPSTSMCSISILASDLEPGRAIEGRYPFSNLMDEASGELRLKLRSVVMHLGDSNNYDTVHTALCNPSKDNLYIPVHGTSLPGGSVSLCYAATALCSLDELLRCLIDEEVQSPAATLFRANTPLTKLLETVMRIYAYEYVRSAVGPTVTEIMERGLVLDEPVGRDSGTAQPDTLSPFVSKLWNDIYLSRQNFPLFLKKVLNHLILAVGKQHKNSKKLQFQAVSSFLFLRCIGPAIMFPNYTAPPSVAVQRTLKALAKPIMSLAFLVEGSEQNQQDKATNDFVEENLTAMTDFLDACATVDADDPVFAIDQRTEDIAAALVKRKSSLRGAEQDAVYVLSVIGAIDLVKELAIISEGLADRPPSASRQSVGADVRPMQDRRNGAATLDDERKTRDSDFPIVLTLGKAITTPPAPMEADDRSSTKLRRHTRLADLGTPNISKRTSSLSGGPALD